MTDTKYHSLGDLQQDFPSHPDETWPASKSRYKHGLTRSVILALAIFTISIAGAMLFLLSLMTAVGLGNTAALQKNEAAGSSTVPLYYQTSPDPYPGPTATALMAPFLIQTDTASFTSGTVGVNSPLQTAYPITGNTNNSNVFQLMGQLSSYFPNPVGFGVSEYPIPPGANLTTVHLLSRHGSRYPTSDSSVSTFGSKVYNLTRTGTAQWGGALSFLTNWQYTLGSEILVPRGRQELFDSGVLFYYNYGSLYNTSEKILARTTTQDRMLKSAEYFMAGMFGLEWTDNVTLINTIELPYYNNSLAGYMQCKNSNDYHSSAGSNASLIWENIYLANATQRLRALSGGYKWTIADSDLPCLNLVTRPLVEMLPKSLMEVSYSLIQYHSLGKLTTPSRRHPPHEAIQSHRTRPTNPRQIRRRNRRRCSPKSHGYRPLRRHPKDPHQVRPDQGRYRYHRDQRGLRLHGRLLH